jgi:hypothetical protein
MFVTGPVKQCVVVKLTVTCFTDEMWCYLNNHVNIVMGCSAKNPRLCIRLNWGMLCSLGECDTTACKGYKCIAAL